MKGYYGRPDATAEAIVDGWFRSGDLARKDADGWYYIVDRSKDMIIRGGYNVYPREVEEVLLTHPDVSLAAVIGVPDESHGEEIKAVVIRKDDNKRETKSGIVLPDSHEIPVITGRVISSPAPKFNYAIAVIATPVTAAVDAVGVVVYAVLWPLWTSMDIGYEDADAGGYRPEEGYEPGRARRELEKPQSTDEETEAPPARVESGA